MRIQNNIMAMNTYRQYNIANNATAGYAEKLSSGYQINRAGDDAAGLAISEKMRAQIRGLNMASKNSLDAVSLIQTAEGALQSTHDILQRMRELAVQSASDSNEQIIDRGALEQEFQALKAEIDDIATTTRFNDQNLLDGTFQKNIRSLNADAVGGTTVAFKSSINSISVSRAKAGNYVMSVEYVEAKKSETIDGAAAKITAGSLVTAAGMADKVSSITFKGVETSEHNGNTYTLLVTNNDTENMTFTLQDSNNKIVAQVQNVNVSGWTSETKNVVDFSGIGSMTFNLNVDEAITSASDLTTLTGAALDFTSEGPYVEAIEDIALVALEATDIGISNFNFKKADNFTYADDTYTLSLKGTVAADAADPSQFVFTITGANGAEAAATIDVSSGAGKYTINIEGFGEFTFETDATFDSTAVVGGEMLGDVATAGSATILTATMAYTNTIEGGQHDATTGTGKLTTTASSAIKVNYTGGTFNATEEGGDGYQVKLTYSATGTPANQVKAELLDSTGTAVKDINGNAITGVVGLGGASFAAGAEFEIDLGDYGIITLTNEGVTAVMSAGTETFAFDGSSDAIKAGVDPYTTAEVKAAVVLTINSESVMLHKGDTTANFTDNGIAFSFNALSDQDVRTSTDYSDGVGIFGSTQVEGQDYGSVDIIVNNTRGQSMIIQTGANQGDELGINIDAMNTDMLGISYSSIATRPDASRAITEVNNAINQVSTQRAALGALQNRLNFKIANLDTSAENLQAAESRIRDTDMAKTMTAFTKSNILGQAATAMLAQANSQPQNVLQLLR